MKKSELKIHPDGAQKWYLNGKYHREDGPAVIHADGTQRWFLNGKYHREDGPAIIRSNGTQKWFLDDEEVDPVVLMMKVYEKSLTSVK